jgi:hypothetical protein
MGMTNGYLNISYKNEEAIVISDSNVFFAVQEWVRNIKGITKTDIDGLFCNKVVAFDFF